MKFLQFLSEYFLGFCGDPTEQRGEGGRSHAGAHLQDDHAGQVHLLGAAQGHYSTENVAFSAA